MFSLVSNYTQSHVSLKYWRAYNKQVFLTWTEEEIRNLFSSHLIFIIRYTFLIWSQFLKLQNTSGITILISWSHFSNNSETCRLGSVIVTSCCYSEVRIISSQQCFNDVSVSQDSSAATGIKTESSVPNKRSEKIVRDWRMPLVLHEL